MRRKLLLLMIFFVTIPTAWGVGDSPSTAQQGFTVVVPPKALFNHKESELARRVTVTASVDIWAQCDTLAVEGQKPAVAKSWGRTIISQQPTELIFPNSRSRTVTVVTFAAF